MVECYCTNRAREPVHRYYPARTRTFLTGTQITNGNGQDDGYCTFALPFAFTPDNTNYSIGNTMTLGSNGCLSFAGSTDGCCNDWVGMSSLVSGMLPFTFDLYNSTASSFYWQVTGTAPNRTLTVEWSAWYSYSYAGDVTGMQILMHESTNVIEFIYKNLNYSEPVSDGGTAGIGLNGASPTSDYIAYATGLTATPSADIRFSPPAPPQELSLVPNPPSVPWSPKTLNFGTAAPGVPVTMIATVKSVGAAGTTIHITGTTLTGSTAYSIVSGPANGTAIAQGSTAQYVLQFAPFSSGTLGGIFTLITDGRDSGTQSINLTGIGAIPAVSYSSTNMFRGVKHRELTDTSGVQYLYVNSTGVGPLSN